MKAWMKIVIDGVVYIVCLIAAYVSCYKLTQHVQDWMDS